MLDCVLTQTRDLDPAEFVFLKDEGDRVCGVFKQVVDFFIVDLDVGALDCRGQIVFPDGLENLKEKPRHKASLLGVMDLFKDSILFYG